MSLIEDLFLFDPHDFNYVWLVLIGIVEAIVYLFRYRTASERSAWVSAFWSFAICVTRILFVYLGASAVIAGTSWFWSIVCYGGAATATTGLLHEWLELRKARRVQR